MFNENIFEEKLFGIYFCFGLCFFNGETKLFFGLMPNFGAEINSV